MTRAVPRLSSAGCVRRTSLLEVQPGPPMSSRVHGWARDQRVTPTPSAVAGCDLAVQVAPDGAITSLDAGPLQHVLGVLVGTPSGSGLRRRLDDLPTDTADLRCALRLLDDLPIITRVAMQTMLLEHPGVPPLDLPTSLAGADQCEGWRSDGTMVQQIRRRGGILTMALSEPVDDSIGPWADAPLAPLPPLATRRRRSIDVTATTAGLEVEAHFRDSYADPDGVERGLHGYGVRASVDPDGTIADVSATAVVLPWPECWRATGSADRLVGRSLRELDQMARGELIGLGTCTHLNDTFRALREVGQLADLLR